MTFEPKGSLEERIDMLEKDSETLKDYIRTLRESMQEESADRIEDFDQLKLTNVPYVDVRTYGLVAGDNSSTVMTKNVAGWNTLIAAVDAGTEIYFPRGIWYINDYLAVSQSVTIRGDGEGSEIQQETSGKRGFYITASNVTIRDLRLYGYGATTDGVSNTDAILFLGTAGDPPTNIVNAKVLNCFIENWELRGIVADYVDNFEFSGNYIKSITYAGILTLGAQDGVISNNRIDDIKGDSTGAGASNNSYGISVTRHTTEDLVEHPRSARIVIANNVVTNAPLWDGISTHAAEDCFFNNNIVKSTMRGINCVGDDTNGPLNNTISNNIVDIGSVAAGESSSGIGIAGESGELATGCIVGNIIIGHGDEDSQISGGLSIKYTQGYAVTGNRLINCASRGIMLYQHNYDFTVSGNTISDVWSATHNVMAIQVNSVYNIGYIGENSWANVTKSTGRYLGSGTSYGIYINNQTGVAISLGNNHSRSADTYISDSGSKAITYTMVTDITTNKSMIANIHFMSNVARVILHASSQVTTGYADFNANNNAIVIPETSGYFDITEHSSWDNLFKVLATGGILMPGLQSGSTQPGGVAAGELWVDTDDQTIKMGT